jgi:hypothetical protein
MTDPSRSKGKVAQVSRYETIIEKAHAAGLLGGTKRIRIAARVSSRLLAAARSRTGITSVTRLIELGIVLLALDDDL